MKPAPSRSALILAALVCALPFEPRHPALVIVGFQVTLLELIAGSALLVLGWNWRGALGGLLRRPPLALGALIAFALVNLLSAMLALDNPARAFKFALRMCVMAGFALVAAAAPHQAVRAALTGLVGSGLAVAALSIGEGAGWRALDAFLGLFREMPFNVAGVRRASGGSEYPNQAAAFQMAALLTWAGFGRAAPRKAAVMSVALSLGILFTYSRGALASAALGLLATAALAGRLARPELRRSSLLALAALGASIAGFAGFAEVFRLRLGGEGTERWYDARYVPADATLRLEPGERRLLGLSVTNTGRKNWARREAFHLSYHWYDTERKLLEDGGRTELPHDLEPGQSVALQAEIVGPAQPGRYLLIWDMVHENTTWFSGQGVRPAVVPAAIGALAEQPLASTVAPPSGIGWRPGRAELWRLALAMGRAHPALGVGPDNFRWLYGRFAAQPYGDTRVFANNTLLEVFATTGLLGAAALFLAWLAALAGTARALRHSADAREGETAAALFALLAGLLAHGVVDHLLAFTGHYLLLGFSIGAAAALGGKEVAQTDPS